MTERDERSKQRAETAREHDDDKLIDNSSEAPPHGGRGGGRMAQDVGTQDEVEHGVEGQSVTRVRAADKKEEANTPRFNRK